MASPTIPAVPDAVHLIVPFAAWPAAPQPGDPTPALTPTADAPRLAALLARLGAPQDLAGDPHSLSMPHEKAWANALGLAVADGAVPLAAWHAMRMGLPAHDDGWAWITLTHWRMGTDHARMALPQELPLDEAESRALFEAVKPSFDAEGWTLLWGAPLRWHVRHEALGGLACASLDRAVGRNLDLWMSDAPEARRLRRMQVEAQMIWHEHPVNAAREEARALTVNSFWLDGCGAAQPRRPLAEAGVQVDDRLRAPLLAGDWAAWVDAWQALDAGPVAALRARAEAGEPVTLTLCGERHARRFDLKPRGWLSRLMGAPRPADASALLASL